MFKEFQKQIFMSMILDEICEELYVNKRQRIPKVQSEMDNPEKKATQGPQDQEKHNTTQRNRQHRVHKTKKNTTQYVLDATVRKQTQIM